MSVHWGGRGPGHVCRSTSGGGGVPNINAILREDGFLVLREDGSYLLREDPLTGISAPSLGYPSPLATNPSSVVIGVPADWQSGNILKLAYSASVTMTSSTILTHTLTNTDITNGTVSIGLPTFVGINYLQGYGNNGSDSSFKSNIVTWGDTTVPVITTAATSSVYEQSPLAVTLAATDAGGVPALVSDGTTSGWYIAGGVDQLQFQIAIVAGVPTLQWINNGTQLYSPSAAFDGTETYRVQIGAIDYGGNKATVLSEAVTVNQIAVAAFSFTNVNNAPLNTLETSNTVTLSITPAGLSVPASLAGTGFTYSKNGGAYQAAGSFTVQNGDTLTLQDTSGNANSITNTCTVTVSTRTATWSVATPGSAAILTTGTGSTGAGVNRSQFINATSFQTILNGAAGETCLDRANLPASNAKFQVEVTVNGVANSIYLGFDDATANCNSSFAEAGQPGGSGGIPGVTFRMGGNLTWTINGTNTNSQAMTAAAANTIFSFAVDTTAHTVQVFENGTLITTVTLTSQIPASWNCLMGGYTGTGTIATSDAATINFGASAFTYPQTGYTYYA